MTDEPPQGWAAILVEKAFCSFGGGTPNKGVSTYWGGNIPWLSSGDIKAERIQGSSECITRLGLENSSANLCRAGSVVVVVRSGILKHTLPVAVLERDAAINQDIKCFDSGNDELNGWLALALRASAGEILALNREGTTVQSVKYETLKEFELPIPPLGEQRRIVAKLDKLLAKVDACHQRLPKIPVLLERFRQSVLAAACSGRLTADWRENANEKELQLPEPPNPKAVVEVAEIFETPENWRWLPLVSLCDPSRAICYGVIKLGAEYPDGIPCLRTSDVKPLRIDTTDVKRIAPEISKEYRRTLLRGGEVLVNVRGTLGGVAVVSSELRDWNISREVALVPIARVLPKFIAFWIASLPCQNWLTGVAKGVAYTGINIKDLRLLPVALPPLAEQQEIVRRVEALFALADQLEARYAKAKAHVEKLTQSILAKAFRGELVPQDPNDEPAEGLLRRIRQQSKKGKKA